MATLPVFNDATAEIRALLAEFDLEELAPWIVQLQLEGITDPSQMLSALEFTTGFQQRFPGYRDPTSGEVLMSIPERLAFERELAEQFAFYGFDPPSRALVGNLVVNRRTARQITEDLQAIDFLQQHPTARRDFFALTGVDADGTDLFAFYLGTAPDLDEAYGRAISDGVVAEEYHRRRLDFESQIRESENTEAGVEGTLGELQLQVDRQTQSLTDLNAQRESIRRQLLQKNSRGLYVVTGAARTSLYAQLNDVKSRIATTEVSLGTLQTTITNTRSELETLNARQAELSASLSELLASPPDLTPNFTPTRPGFARNELLHALTRARRMEEARFRAGGSAVVSRQPIARPTL